MTAPRAATRPRYFQIPPCSKSMMPPGKPGSAFTHTHRFWYSAVVVDGVSATIDARGRLPSWSCMNAITAANTWSSFDAHAAAFAFSRAWFTAGTSRLAINAIRPTTTSSSISVNAARA